ncbi:MAG: proline iminopeptidase-family hydrolase [Planctomycetia bacterium]|nr:MAG: proline iminopeptidase-family hydrolase [Planctomycetia bacterium]
MVLVACGAAVGCSALNRPPVVVERRVAVTGGDVWCQVVGADKPGVPLLVLHGGPGVPHDYLLPLNALANQRPVIFYDQLGCGNSERPTDESLWTIERFVDELDEVRMALKLDRVHILGHSWGTMLAVEYMLQRRPPGVISLTLAGPALSMQRWAADQRVWMLELPRPIQEAIRSAESAGTFETLEYQDAVGVFYARHVCRVDPWPDYVQRALSPEKMGRQVYFYMNGPSEFTCTGTIRDYERVDRLREITTPALFICGRYDEATPAATEYYHRNMPGSELAVIENASHLAWVEQPDEYFRVLRAFLHRSETGPRAGRE